MEAGRATSVDLLNSPELRGGGGLGGSKDRLAVLLTMFAVEVRLGGCMNLSLIADGRNASMDLRTGGSGGIGR